MPPANTPYLRGMKKDRSSLPVTDRRGNASSNSIGIMLMLAVTFLLALLVLLLMIQLPSMYDTSVPSIFKIIKIRHDDGFGHINYDSRMTIINSATSGFKNRNLEAETYRNGVRLDCRIPTFQGSEFLQTHHFRIQNLGGPGSCDATWDPNEMVFIDFTDGTFRPGDTVTFEVYDKISGQIISRHTYAA